jgi:hypothetical protein
MGTLSLATNAVSLNAFVLALVAAQVFLVSPSSANSASSSSDALASSSDEPAYAVHPTDTARSPFFAAHEYRRERIFEAQVDKPAVECTTPDPCLPHGQCADGSGCVCDQDGPKGFWTGTLCTDCDTGWAGPDCTIPCLGGTCNECNGHGFCRSGINGDGTCDCYNDNINGHYTGSDCTACVRGYFGDGCLQSCPGSDSDFGECNGKGTCQANIAGDATCKCDSGWDAATGCATCDHAHWGPGCNRVCDGYIAAGDRPCSGHGICFNGTTGNGTCVCYPGTGYGTFDCSRRCPYNCFEPDHGTCNEGAENDANCVCRENYEMPDCANCIANRTGPQCIYPCPINTNVPPKEVCSGAGVCVFNNTGLTVSCRCAIGFYGPTCENKCSGNPPCGGHGVCVNGTCQCFSDDARGYWEGDNCDRCQQYYNQSLLCNQRCPEANGLVCNGHGACAAGRCYCVRKDPVDRLDYCGTACETASPPGLINEAGCVGCTCVYCDQEYTLGADCSIDCAGRTVTTDGVVACSNHGYCAQGKSQNDETCVCQAGYAGTAASAPGRREATARLWWTAMAIPYRIAAVSTTSPVNTASSTAPCSRASPAAATDAATIPSPATRSALATPGGAAGRAACRAPATLTTATAITRRAPTTRATKPVTSAFAQATSRACAIAAYPGRRARRAPVNASVASPLARRASANSIGALHPAACRAHATT